MSNFKKWLSLLLMLPALVSFGQQTGSTVTYPSSGKIVTEDGMKEYVFDVLEKYVKANCDLRVTQIVKDGNSFEFGVAVSLPNITQYTIKIERGTKKWFWYNVPYAQTGKIRIQNVPALDSLRIVIRPTAFPDCYVSFSADGTNPSTDPGPVDPNPNPCPAIPSIPVITNISSTGIRAAVSATNITNINWFIYNLNSPTVNLRSGTRAFAQTMDITWNDALPAGDYGFRMEAVNCTASTSKTFTIQSTTPAPTNCAAGPEIRSIYNVLTTGITTQFHGNNVTQIKWIVKDATGASVREGQLVPTSSVLNLTFSSPITAGNYTLRLEGVNCTGFSESNFTLTSGGSDPPPPSGTIVAKYVVRGLPEHLDIVVNGSGTSKTLTDNATITPPTGYSFRYYINGQQVVQSTRLINFPWPSDVPVMIYKMQIRNGYTGDAFSWGYDEGWKDPNIGQPFSYNTSVAFNQIVFDDANSGYNPSKQTVQWMDYLPDMPSTDSKIWVAPIGALNTPEQLIAKGVTHFNNYEISPLPTAKQVELISAGRTYDEASKTDVQLLLPNRGSGQWVPPGQQYPQVWNTQFFDYTPGQTEPLTVAQGAEKGNQYSSPHRIMVFENSENNHAVSPHWPFWRAYYQNLTARAQQRFPGTWRIAHNYFTGAVGRYPDPPTDGSPDLFLTKKINYGQSPMSIEYNTRSQALAFLDAPVSDWPGSEMLPGGTLASLNSACYGLYFGSPDHTNEHPYRMIYAADRTHAIGKYLFAFMQEFYEWFPNNYVKINYPTGIFYLQQKMPHSQAQLYNIALFSRIFLEGFIPFGAGVKGSGNFNFPRAFNQGLWFPNGATSPQSSDTFPYWSQQGSNVPHEFPSDGFEDGIARGMYAYSQTFMKTTGGTRQFLRFRVNGGSWIEVSNDKVKDVVNAYFDKRGFAFSEIKNGKIAILYFNGFADASIKTVECQYNGVTYSLQSASCQATVKLFNL